MWMYPGGPFSVLAGVWAALSSGVAHLVTKRRLPAALLTGLLVSQWPRIEMLLRQRPLYGRVMRLQMRVLSALYSFRARRDAAEEERHRREAIERLGFDPEIGPPRPATLRQVIPVGQTVRLEGATLTALSVESYEEGFVAHFRLLSDEEPARPDPFDMDFLHVFVRVHGLEVRDDRGHRYPVLEGGGGGGGSEWRFEYRSAWPIDPEAHELVLELAEVRWERLGRRLGEPQLERVEAGPWRFAVPL
jgi:hypothetical protein